MALDLFATFLLVAANGFFVATEFAVARLRITEVEELERDGRPGAKSALHAVEHIDSYLAACQLGITLASLGLGIVGKPVFEELLEPVLGEGAAVAGFGVAAAIAFSFVTLLHVVIGELAPKSLAISRTRPTALLVAPPMRAFYLVTKPVVDLFNGMGNLLLKPFGVPPAREAGHAPHSEAELRQLLHESQQEGLIDRGDRDLTENVFDFGDRRTREIMTPRPEVDFVTTADDLRSVAAVATRTGHTRLPVCEPAGDLDAPVGVIHAKDLMAATLEQRDATIADLARPIGRVFEAMLLVELLRALRRDRRHIALVVDEHGTTVGIVTLEDILEELVGEIEDEFDAEPGERIVREGDSVMVDGGLSIREVEHELGVRIADPHEATIGGHLLELLGRLPEEGQMVELDGLRIEVCDVDEASITRLRIHPAAAS